MEQTEGEIDSLDGDISIALFALAGYINIVEGKVLKFLESPRREHKPGNDGIEQEKDGVSNASCHAALEDTALMANG